MNAEQRDVGRDDSALEGMGQSVADVIVIHGAHGCGVGNAVDVEQSGERHANRYGDGEVGEDGEGEGDEPDRDGGEVQFKDAADFLPLAHVVSHDKQDGGQGGERNIGGQGRGYEQNSEESERHE